jgi:hypothetical protein
MIDEMPRRIAARRGFSVSYKGKTLLSTMDPEALAQSVVAALPPKAGPTLYLCPSPLYGYGLPLLLAGIGPGSAVLCVETDEALLAFSRETMDESLLGDPRLLLAGAGDGAVLCALVRETWGSRSFRRVEQLRLSGGWRLSPEAYDALEDTLRRELALEWGNAMTLVKLGRLYARNALRNLALLPRSLALPALDFGAAPVLVLGAGPSLDGFLEGLAAYFGDLSETGSARPFKIICADTALSSLRERRIKPDLAVALECQHWNLRDFIGLGAWEIPVAMDLSALCATSEMLGGHPRVFFTPWTRLGLFDRLRSAGLLPEEFPPLGSVGLSAAAIACRVSSGPVVVAGMDFSFTLDMTHARSAPAHLEKLRGQTRFRSLIDPAGAFRRGCYAVSSKTGEPLRSNRTMINYRDLFQYEFAPPSGQGGRVRDVAGPGLDLGLETLGVEAACVVLAGGGAGGGQGSRAPRKAADTAAPVEDRAKAVRDFAEAEISALQRLRGILTGEISGGSEQLETLLDRCDYLWAHFPDCAGAEGRRPEGTALGFLKRVRAEVDPFIVIFKALLLRLAGA